MSEKVERWFSISERSRQPWRQHIKNCFQSMIAASSRKTDFQASSAR